MGRRRAIEHRLALFDELTGILGAMRSFALSELHRGVQREAAVRRILAGLGESLASVTGRALAPDQPPRAGHTAWLLLGSQRGFCGGFNESVLSTWRSRHRRGEPVIAVGDRLVALLPPEDCTVAIGGADGVLEVMPVMDSIIAAYTGMLRRPGADFDLAACVHGEHGTLIIPVLPLRLDDRMTASMAPLLNEDPVRVADGISEQLVFHRLLGLLLGSLCTENRRRLRQMESALKHLRDTGADLRIRRNRLRQEEIVEEIENVIGGRMHLHPPEVTNGH